MRRCIPICLCLLFVPLIAGCPDTDDYQRKAQEKLQAEGDRQVGLPKITQFTEKKLTAMIYELRDQANLPTWTYTIDVNGRRHLLCRSIGYGIPYSTQFSNPMKRTANGGLPQAEPNGLFMPSSAQGTWIIMATKEGPKPLYCEPEVVVSPVPLPEDGVEAYTSPGHKPR